jgi:hypothetical protein
MVTVNWMDYVTGRPRWLAVSLVGLAMSFAGCSSSGRHAVSSSPTSAGGTTVAGGAPADSRSGGGTCGGGPSAGNGTGPEASPPGDIPDNQAFVIYQAPTAGYSVKVPEGWARATQGKAVTFTDKFNSVRVEQLPAAAAPTPATAEAELAGVARQATCYEAGKVTTVSRQAGTAVLASYRADSPPNAVTAKVVHQDIERYEFWRNGTELVLTLASPHGSDNVDPWRKITDSLTWLR